MTSSISQADIQENYWFAGHDCYVNEPMFVPRKGSSGKEDDGWVLVPVFDASIQKSHLAILDAARLENGPVCKVQLPHHIPQGAVMRHNVLFL